MTALNGDWLTSTAHTVHLAYTNTCNGSTGNHKTTYTNMKLQENKKTAQLKYFSGAFFNTNIIIIYR